MSLLSRNELALRLGPRHCRAEWRRGATVHAVAGDAALAGAIDGLEAAAAPALRRAALSLEDEYVYFTSLPASAGPTQALGAAQDYFAAMLGEAESLVGVTLTPCGRRWLAAAVDLAQLQGWEDALAARGIALVAVRPALLDDLRRLRDEVSIADGLLVLVRHEGVSIVTLRGGAVHDVGWERCDVADASALVQRVRAQPDAASADICLVPTHAAQAAGLQAIAQAQGWQLARAVLRDDA